MNIIKCDGCGGEIRGTKRDRWTLNIAGEQWLDFHPRFGCLEHWHRNQHTKAK